MKQILQNLKTGATVLVDVPMPVAGRGQVLIQSRCTVLSSGTERMLVDFGKAGWLEKARQQPEKVKQVLDKIRTDGLAPTVEAVMNKLDEPMPLGYCNAGVVLQVGEGVMELQPGDRVVSNGPHAEAVCVPRNLCAKIPAGVAFEEAAFTVLSSIALQGVRLAAPTLGERFMVFGLGMLGLLTVQLLKASGCRVLAVDFSEKRLRLADSFGADTVNLAAGSDPVAAGQAWAGGAGVDGVLITASAKKDEIVHQAAQSCRKRGRIILVGVVDLNLRRADFYDKELTFQVSCSYGPGRYDEKYEQAGHDYPFGFVRWTEQRNFEAILEAMRSSRLDVKTLITHRLAFDRAVDTYDRLIHNPEALGVVIEYPPTALEIKPDSQAVHFSVQTKSSGGNAASPVVGVIGAGNYARSTLLPALACTPARLSAVADINPVAAAYAAKKFGAAKALSDYKVILNDPAVQAVFVLVGHHLHASFVQEALAAGKHVFVEKPLAINEAQLYEVTKLYTGLDSRLRENDHVKMVMVGFNRRFSPHIVKVKELLADHTGPLCMTMTVNAGFIPPEHWTQDTERGGGRIIGEGCHFIDVLAYLSGNPVVSVSSMMTGGSAPIREDKMSILLGFADGSVGTVHYFANGAKSYPKETLEIFGEGKVIRLENFRATLGFGFKTFRSFRTWRQDKGHRAEIAAFIEAVAVCGPPLIPFNEIINVTKASLAAVESAKTGKVISI